MNATVKVKANTVFFIVLPLSKKKAECSLKSSINYSNILNPGHSAI
jgi:hypothetical protein